MRETIAAGAVDDLVEGLRVVVTVAVEYHEAGWAVVSLLVSFTYVWNRSAYTT